jgi:sodium/potassium-transporting ATPase subunit alpha
MLGKVRESSNIRTSGIYWFQITRRVVSWLLSQACFQPTPSSLAMVILSSMCLSFFRSARPDSEFTCRLSADQLVAGDIVKITLGAKVPADIRLLEVSSDLKFDRSILTGESDAISGTVDSTDQNCT